MIDDLDHQISDIERELERLGADHTYIPLLVSAPGIAWVLGYTIAAEIGDINRFATATKLVGYSGLCPKVYQSGGSDRRGQLTHAGPRHLRWALMEAATHAGRHPVYRDRYQRTKTRLGKQRGAKVAQVDIARRLAEAIWYMLTHHQPFAPTGATVLWPRRRPFLRCAIAATPYNLILPPGGDRELSPTPNPPRPHPP